MIWKKLFWIYEDDFIDSIIAKLDIETYYEKQVLKSSHCFELTKT